MDTPRAADAVDPHASLHGPRFAGQKCPYRVIDHACDAAADGPNRRPGKKSRAASVSA